MTTKTAFCMVWQIKVSFFPRGFFIYTLGHYDSPSDLRLRPLDSCIISIGLRLPLIKADPLKYRYKGKV